MGGIYTLDGRRCCDMCGRRPGDGVERLRYFRCPEGFCSVIAVCAPCRREKRHLHTPAQRECCRKALEELRALRREAKRKPEVLA